MKKYLILFVLLIGYALNSNADYWLCVVNQNVNLRECASKDCRKIIQIPAGSYVVADFSDQSNGYVKVLYIDCNLEGYVYTTYLKRQKELEIDRNGVLQKVGTSYNYDPELKIKNKTNLKITVKLNEHSYHFDKQEERIITCEPGNVSIMASAPGVLPYIGEEVVESNTQYNWDFFIITTRK